MYLKSVFGDDNEDQPEEIRHVRTRMRECYEHMSCFLLPDPGKKIKKSTFQGELSALEKDFRTHLEAFVPQVLSVCVGIWTVCFGFLSQTLSVYRRTTLLSRKSAAKASRATT